MFSSKPKPLSSPSRVSIEEANSHLKLVHQRVEQLESVISKRDQQLIQNEEIHRQEVQRLTHSYDKHCKDLNRQIESLKSKVNELETNSLKQNQIITENVEKLQILSQIMNLAPNLDKLLTLMNGLAVGHKLSTQLDNQTINTVKSNINSNSIQNNNNNNNNQKTVKNKSPEQLNGFSDHSKESAEETPHLSQSAIGSNRNSENSHKMPKKCVKYKSDHHLSQVCGAEEEVKSTTSSSTTASGQSPSVNSVGQTDCDSTEKVCQNKFSNSKMRIGRSFNITSNFSDDEEVVSDRRSSGRRKKITEI